MNKALKVLAVCEGDKKAPAKGLVIHGFSAMDHGAFGMNHTTDITHDGKQYTAIKQGGLGIWAFGGRTKMSNADQSKFDKELDKAYDAHMKKTGQDKATKIEADKNEAALEEARKKVHHVWGLSYNSDSPEVSTMPECWHHVAGPMTEKEAKVMIDRGAKEGSKMGKLVALPDGEHPYMSRHKGKEHSEMSPMHWPHKADSASAAK